MTILEEAYVPVTQAHELVQQYFATYLPAEEVDHAVWMFERSYPLEEATDWLHESSKDPVWNRLIIGLRCGQLLPRPARRLLDQVYGSEQLRGRCWKIMRILSRNSCNSCAWIPKTAYCGVKLFFRGQSIVVPHSHVKSLSWRWWRWRRELSLFTIIPVVTSHHPLRILNLPSGSNWLAN